MSTISGTYHTSVQDIYDTDPGEELKAGNRELSSQMLKSTAASEMATYGTSSDASNPQLESLPPGAAGGLNGFNAISGQAMVATLASKTMHELKNLETALTLLEEQLHHEEMALKLASAGAKRDATVVRAMKNFTKVAVSANQYVSKRNIGKEFERQRTQPQGNAAVNKTDPEAPTSSGTKRQSQSTLTTTVTNKKSKTAREQKSQTTGGTPLPQPPTQRSTQDGSRSNASDADSKRSDTADRPPPPPSSNESKKSDGGTTEVEVHGSSTAQNTDPGEPSAPVGGRSIAELQNASQMNENLGNSISSALDGGVDLAAGELDYVAERLGIMAEETGHVKEGVGKAAGELKNFIGEILQMLSKMADEEAAVTKETMQLRS